MKVKDKIYICEIRISAENPDVAFEVLSIFFNDFTLKDFPGKKFYQFRKYFDTIAEADKFSSEFRLHRKEMFDLGVRFSNISVREIAHEDWAEVWKKKFRPIQVGKRILVKPSWVKSKTSKKNGIVIELDPGMSFGTGQHETTGFCLEMIEKYREERKEQSFLDIGCGSGILSIAAYKLGYRPVVAFDNDKEAVLNTRENFERNFIPDGAIQLKCLSVENAKVWGCFDVIAANLIYDLLVRNLDVISSLLNKNAILILAGILDEQSDDIERVFAKFAVLEKISRGGWTGFVMRKI